MFFGVVIRGGEVIKKKRRGGGGGGGLNSPSCGYPGNSMKVRQLDLRFRVSKTLDYGKFSPPVGCEHCEGYCSNSNLHSARTLQRSAPQPLPTTSSRTSAVHHVQ